jgi:hypothetical protein
MLLAALLAGCGNSDWQTVGDAYWNPYDKSEQIWSTGAPFTEETYEDPYYDADRAFHDDYDYFLDYDARGYGLSNGDLTLTGAHFADHYNYDEWFAGYDSWGYPYYDYDEDYYSDMSFDFRLDDGADCTMIMARSGYLFDPDIDWGFTYDAENPDRSLESGSNYYSCPDRLPVKRAVEGISEILR